jgi:methylglutaconyl-CoA hydratase
MPELALLHLDGPIATMTLNRPDARNALSLDLMHALHARFTELSARAEVVAVILTGAGKSFCAGMDLKQVLADPDAPGRLLGSLAEFTLNLRAFPGIVIASVNGAAIGGGCGLATVCDFAITHADSKMGFPEVDLGVCPAVVAPWLVRRIGAGKARRVLLGGGTMSGREAHALGIVTDLVETREQLDAGAKALADHIAAGGPEALRATKRLLNELDGSLDADLGRRSAQLSADVLRNPKSIEALRARLGP